MAENETISDFLAFIEAAGRLVNSLDGNKFKINQVLYTKDGRRFGNCIIQGYSNKTELYKLKSDYGNIIFLFEKEILRNFRFGYIASDSHKNFTQIK